MVVVEPPEPSALTSTNGANGTVAVPKVLYELHLPPSVTNPLGCAVHLLGTAHTSQESADEARKLVQDVKPDLVLVELCEARQSLLKPQPTQKVPTLEEMIAQFRERKQPLWGIVYGKERVVHVRPRPTDHSHPNPTRSHPP